MQKISENSSYLNAKQAAEAIGISSRRIRQLASQGRIVGAFLHIHDGWLIPAIINVRAGKRGPKFSGNRIKSRS